MAVFRFPSSMVYTGEDRREVEVLVDGAWCPGELRSWDRADDGSWSGIVLWSAGPAQNRLEVMGNARNSRTILLR